MSTKRRRFTSEAKFEIVLEAIKGQRSIAEIAAEHKVHPNQITKWKQDFIKNGASVFSNKKEKEDIESEELENSYLRKIGKQQVEIDFLKKSLLKWEIMKKNR